MQNRWCAIRLPVVLRDPRREEEAAAMAPWGATTGGAGRRQRWELQAGWHRGSGDYGPSPRAGPGHAGEYPDVAPQHARLEGARQVTTERTPRGGRRVQRVTCGTVSPPRLNDRLGGLDMHWRELSASYCCFLNFGRPGQSQGQEGDFTFHEQPQCFHVSIKSDRQF